MPVTMQTRVTNIGGQIVATEYQGGDRYLIEPDALGSTRSLIDETGAEADSYTYWPYGEQRTATVGMEFPFKFCGTWGYYTDPFGTSVPLYVRARYYRQTTGRWMTVDPLWPDEQAYGYVEQGPASRIDPSGASSCAGACCCCPTSLKITNPSPIPPYKNSAEERVGGYGTHFTVEYALTYSRSAQAKADGDCKMEWWEKAWPGYFQGMDADFVDVFAKADSIQEKAWNSHKKLCPGKVAGSLWDGPQWNGKQSGLTFCAWFKARVVIKGQQGCNCGSVEVKWGLYVLFERGSFKQRKFGTGDKAWEMPDWCKRVQHSGT